MSVSVCVLIHIFSLPPSLPPSFSLSLSLSHTHRGAWIYEEETRERVGVALVDRTESNDRSLSFQKGDVILCVGKGERNGEWMGERLGEKEGERGGERSRGYFDEDDVDFGDADVDRALSLSLSLSSLCFAGGRFARSTSYEVAFPQSVCDILGIGLSLSL